MANVLSELLSLLRLERLEVNLFRGQSQDLGWGTVFGGQVLGQALSAAEQTVTSSEAEPRTVHSLHGYFLRPGDARQPIIYDVDCIRDGKSFTTRRVVAIQKGRAIFSMACSFQRHEEGYDHQDPMPEVTPPEALLSETEIARKFEAHIPPPMRERALAERPIIVKPVSPENPLKPQKRPPLRQVWYRTAEVDTQLPDELSVHQYLLAYASDFNLLGSAMQPHGVSWLTPGMQVASLDHAMWFHRPFRMDEWLLYVIESPSASGARGLGRGRFFRRDGTLVASTMQEGLMRQHR